MKRPTKLKLARLVLEVFKEDAQIMRMDHCGLDGQAAADLLKQAKLIVRSAKPKHGRGSK